MGFFSSRKTTELESDHYHVMTTMIEATGGTGVGGGNVGEKSVVKVIRSRFVSGFLCWSFFFFWWWFFFFLLSLALAAFSFDLGGGGDLLNESFLIFF